MHKYLKQEKQDCEKKIDQPEDRMKVLGVEPILPQCFPLMGGFDDFDISDHSLLRLLSLLGDFDVGDI